MKALEACVCAHALEIARRTVGRAPTNTNTHTQVFSGELAQAKKQAEQLRMLVVLQEHEMAQIAARAW